MIVRLEALGKSSESLMGVIADRLNAEEKQHLEDIEAHTDEQNRLIANMKRIVRS